MPFWTDNLCERKGPKMDGSNLVTVDTMGRLLTLADTPEFQELMAAIDEILFEVNDRPRDINEQINLSTSRLEGAKEDLLAKVGK
jgi:hypothetical protein